MGCGPAECVGDYGDTSCLPPTDTSPTKAPTIPEGCYSMNYMDCLPAEISNHDFCNKIWLPAGAQNNCAPLGGQCSNVLSCCGPAECVGDYGDTSCLPSTDTPNTSSPTKAPSSAPSSSCIHCDNVGTNYMIENGKDCTAVNLGNKCIKKKTLGLATNFVNSVVTILVSVMKEMYAVTAKLSTNDVITLGEDRS